ncbi:GGDEF domain-containing protein [candidate division WOR-3 bacterium]|nr:GGDEF domain-containing protein [candidate division WOR-3 bacterium]
MKRFLCFFILVLIIPGFHISANDIEELEKKLQDVAGKERVEVLDKLAKAYREISPKKTLEYSKEALELSQELNYKKGEALSLHNFGLGYYYLGDYEKALDYNLKSLEIRKKTDDKDGIAASLYNIGRVYVDLSNYDKALEYYLRSLKIREIIGDKKDIAASLNDIGIIYDNLGRYKKALEYYLQSLEIRELIEDKNGIAASLNNTGIAYDNLDDSNKALKYYLKALKIYEEIGNNKGIAASLNNIGLVYENSGNYKKSLEYQLRSLKIEKEIGNKYGIAISLNNIGSLYLKLKNYDEAFSYLEQGLNLAKEIRAKVSIQDSYRHLSELYSTKGNYKKALEYYELYSEAKDSIFTKEGSKKIAEMQTKYETEKKEKEIGLLKKDKVIEQSRKRMFVFSLIVTLSIIAFLIYLYRLKIKINKRLDLLSRIDPLTKLSNRRDILEKIEMERIRFERYKRPFVLVLCDIDKFKNFNDKYGHNAGDSILASIARLMHETIRMQDSISRWGGEEFLFLLPETHLEGGRILAEKIRNKIADNVYHQEKHKLSVYMTFGVSEYDEVMSIDDCIKQADNALYEGKKNGGNQVVVAKPSGIT